MRPAYPLLLIADVLVLPGPCPGQVPERLQSGPDSVAFAGAEAGRRAAASASVELATWGTAATNLFLGPAGGLGAVLLLHPSSDLQ